MLVSIRRLEGHAKLIGGVLCVKKDAWYSLIKLAKSNLNENSLISLGREVVRSIQEQPVCKANGPDMIPAFIKNIWVSVNVCNCEKFMI